MRSRALASAGGRIRFALLGHRLFLEVVQRVGGYDGYGEVNAPVRAAAQLATVDAAADGSGLPRW